MAGKPVPQEELLKCLAAVKECGNVSAAARKLGMPRATLVNRMKVIQADGELAEEARTGYAPEHDLVHSVPDGYHLKGASTLYGKDGDIKLQWVKSQIDHTRMTQIFTAAAEALACTIEPIPEIPFAHKQLRNDLLNLHIITDYHFGMLSWHGETGADWDTKIAEELLYAWFMQAARVSPEAGVGVVAFLGDFLHFCGLTPETPEHGNVLDADTRFYKIVRSATRVLRRVITTMLERYPKVVVIFCEGNHDENATPWLQVMFSALFEDNPRVEIMTRADPYYAYAFGDTLLFFHHGHKRKVTNIESVFISKFREEFGNSKFSYAHMGHLHQDRVLETPTMHVEQHETLTAPDAFATRGGYMSGRSAKVITYSSQFGEVGRQIISQQMIEALHRE